MVMPRYTHSATATQDRASPRRADSDLMERQLQGGMLRNGRGAPEVVGELREEDFATDPHRRSSGRSLPWPGATGRST